MLGNQFAEQMNLRKQLGGLVAENRRLYPIPASLGFRGSQGRPGMIASAETVPEQNQVLREKIASTEVSNAIGRGERPPTADRFG